MKTDILPTGESRTSKILPSDDGKASKILPVAEKTPSVLPDEVRSWNGSITAGRKTVAAGVIAALLALALFGFSTLSPQRLTRDLTRRYWIQQDTDSGTILLLQFGEEYADLYIYSLFGAQQVGSAPYEVSSFRTIKMGDTTITVDILNHTLHANPAIVTGASSEVWLEGY